MTPAVLKGSDGKLNADEPLAHVHTYCTAKRYSEPDCRPCAVQMVEE